MDININGLWLQQLSQVMDVLQVKHKTVANNIANTNTPGYVRQEVNFQNELSKVLANDPAVNQPAGQSVEGTGRYSPMAYQDIEVVEDPGNPARRDGNNINLESEMVELTQTGQVYKTLSRIAAKKFKLASYVIRGGH